MQFTLAIVVAIMAAVTNAAVIEERKPANKANEYKSADCSGDLNYGHHGDSSRLDQCINMDASSHSVYMAKGSRYLTAYSKPGCSDLWRLGSVAMQPPCQNLDGGFVGFEGQRIGSLKFD